MQQRYRLYRRADGNYYVQDNVTRQQESLRTGQKSTALRLIHCKNEAQEQPLVNLQIARAYLAASDPIISTRTWQTVMDAIVKMKGAETERRWLVAIKDKAFDSIRHNPLIETRSDHFLRVLQTGTVSTNVYLRRLHNFALDMSWLPGPILPRRCWPKVKFKEKRAITFEEHQQIVEREGNTERRAFYQMCWHLGGSQTDMACLRAEDINWPDRMISYNRRKTGELAQIQFGKEMEKVLTGLPQSGPLFPYLRTVRSADRATEFRQRCAGLGIKGVTLHGYRYSWAQRAKDCGFPERFAMQMLGHGSKAVHRAYSRTTHVRVPSLEQYEHAHAKDRLIPIGFQTGKIKNL